MKYQVTIEESFSKTFEVNANSPEEAEKLVHTDYMNNNISIPRTFTSSRQIAVNCEETGYSEGWRPLVDSEVTPLFSRS